MTGQLQEFARLPAYEIVAIGRQVLIQLPDQFRAQPST
jgi:hypothetical protein